jgi:uncharacterized membrane protein YjgN (DUF898 family)
MDLSLWYRCSSLLYLSMEEQIQLDVFGVLCIVVSSLILVLLWLVLRSLRKQLLVLLSVAKSI